MRLFLLTVLMIMGVSALGRADDSLTITYYAYPPKMQIIDGKPFGSRIDQMKAIVEAAGMKVRWLRASPNQEADMLDAGRRRFCATGRSYSRERAKRWVYLPYYLDALSTLIVVARTEDAARIRTFATIGDVLADGGLRGALINHYIYGPVVDPLIAHKPAWISMEADTVRQALDMVRAGRAHYTLTPGQYWRVYQKDHDGAKDLVGIDKFGTMTSNPLYIPCSRAVDPLTIGALSAAMSSLGYRPVNFQQLHAAE